MAFDRTLIHIRKEIEIEREIVSLIRLRERQKESESDYRSSLEVHEERCHGHGSLASGYGTDHYTCR